MGWLGELTKKAVELYKCDLLRAQQSALITFKRIWRTPPNGVEFVKPPGFPAPTQPGCRAVVFMLHGKFLRFSNPIKNRLIRGPAGLCVKGFFTIRGVGRDV